MNNKIISKPDQGYAKLVEEAKAHSAETPRLQGGVPSPNMDQLRKQWPQYQK
jgi:hypothetical protein